MAYDWTAGTTPVPGQQYVAVEKGCRSILVNTAPTPPLPSSFTTSTGQVVTVPGANGTPQATQSDR